MRLGRRSLTSRVARCHQCLDILPEFMPLRAFILGQLGQGVRVTHPQRDRSPYLPVPEPRGRRFRSWGFSEAACFCSRIRSARNQSRAWFRRSARADSESAAASSPWPEPARAAVADPRWPDDRSSGASRLACLEDPFGKTRRTRHRVACTYRAGRVPSVRWRPQVLSRRCGARGACPPVRQGVWRHAPPGPFVPRCSSTASVGPVVVGATVEVERVRKSTLGGDLQDMARS